MPQKHIKIISSEKIFNLWAFCYLSNDYKHEKTNTL